MPLNARKFFASAGLVLLFIFTSFAQSPTSADVMRERIIKAKAYVAVRNYSAAIYELEGIKRETSDPTVNSVVQVMLMNCYLEQSDYKRAQSLVTELFNTQKSNRPSNYFAVAAQVVKGARNQLERYKSLGLMISDRSLPADAVADINKMRETVETVITQSKTLGENKKDSSNALALLEEASNVRSGLARDDYDAKRWKDEVADARERLMSSRSTVVNAVNDSFTPNTTTNTNPTPNNPSNNFTTTPKTSETLAVKEAPKETPQTQNTTPEINSQVSTQTPTRERRIENTNTQVTETKPKNETETTTDKNAPLPVGSLIEYATQKVNPVYPPAAKNIRVTGIVRVDVVVNKEGEVASVQNTSGPKLLQRAALDALKRWKFKPFTRDGQPVQATGFVSFNFSL